MNKVNINGRVSKIITTDAQKRAGLVQNFIVSTKRFNSSEWDECFCAMDFKKWNASGLSEGVWADFSGSLKSETFYLDKDDKVVKKLEVGSDGRLTDGKGNFVDKRIVKGNTKMYVSVDDVKIVTPDEVKYRIDKAKEILSGSVSV